MFAGALIPGGRQPADYLLFASGEGGEVDLFVILVAPFPPLNEETSMKS